MGGLILGVNTLYRLFCFFKLFPMVGKGLIGMHIAYLSAANYVLCVVSTVVMYGSVAVIYKWHILYLQTAKREEKQRKQMSTSIYGHYLHSCS